MSDQTKPLVTFAVPCYNSASFMTRAVDSLLAAHKPCEILLINDGSSDDTSKIAHSYAERYPQVRAIDQDNANWGGAVNHALELAQGSYFKVVDSDDYMEPMALHRVLDALAQAVEAGDAPDLLITNYVYDHLTRKYQRTLSYEALFPQGRIFAWDEMRRGPIDIYIMIHACWYATDILRASGVKLPTGVPYTDSLLLLHPMPMVQKLMYLSANPYWYAIGREGQSVGVDVMQRQIDKQISIAKLAIDDTDYAELYAREPKCATLMTGYMICMMAMTMLSLFTIGTPEAIQKNDDLWAHAKEHNPELYQRLCRSWVGVANRKTALGRALMVRCFAIGKKYFTLE